MAVNVKITTDTSGLSKGLNNAKQQLKSTGAATTSTADAMDAMGDNVDNAVRALDSVAGAAGAASTGFSGVAGDLVALIKSPWALLIAFLGAATAAIWDFVKSAQYTAEQQKNVLQFEGKQLQAQYKQIQKNFQQHGNMLERLKQLNSLQSLTNSQRNQAISLARRLRQEYDGIGHALEQNFSKAAQITQQYKLQLQIQQKQRQNNYQYYQKQLHNKAAQFTQLMAQEIDGSDTLHDYKAYQAIIKIPIEQRMNAALRDVTEDGIRKNSEFFSQPGAKFKFGRRDADANNAWIRNKSIQEFQERMNTLVTDPMGFKQYLTNVMKQPHVRANGEIFEHLSKMSQHLDKMIQDRQKMLQYASGSEKDIEEKRRINAQKQQALNKEKQKIQKIQEANAKQQQALRKKQRDYKYETGTRADKIKILQSENINLTKGIQEDQNAINVGDGTNVGLDLRIRGLQEKLAQQPARALDYEKEIANLEKQKIKRLTDMFEKKKLIRKNEQTILKLQKEQSLQQQKNAQALTKQKNINDILSEKRKGIMAKNKNTQNTEQDFVKNIQKQIGRSLQDNEMTQVKKLFQAQSLINQQKPLFKLTNEVKTNALAARGGFASSVTAEKSRDINKQIAVNTKKQIDYLRNIEKAVKDSGVI